MKTILISFFAFLTCYHASSQEAIVYPYNPDADHDELIGITDLLPVLSIFGENFQPGEIVVDGVALAEVLLTMQQTIEALQLQVEALEAQALPELAAHLSFIDSSSTFHLEGANLQLSNGVSPYSHNGLGNLIIGMNGETEYIDSIGRGGSHNLVIGEGHAYSSNHGILHGYNATATDRYAAIIGGASNRVDGAYGVTIAGTDNVILDNALYSATIGGRDNTISANYAVAAAGLRSQVDGAYSAAISGNDNRIAEEAIYAAALAGKDNVLEGARSATVSGAENIAYGERSVVLGGIHNESHEWDAVLVGGRNNDNHGSETVIVGGQWNHIGSDSTDTRFSVVVGGRFADLNAGYCGVISGGYGNTLAPDSLGDVNQTCSIFGGNGNTNAGSTSATMVGGAGNQLNQRPGGGADLSIGVNSFIGNIQYDNTQNIRVTGEPEEE